MGQMWRELRYAARGLLRSPGTSAIGVVALALGIGLTTIMFSIVYGALVRGLPFDDSDRIMHLERSRPSEGIESMEVSIHDYTDWVERQRSFESIGAFRTGTVNIRGSERPERYDGAFVTANTFDVLGVAPIVGRTFTPDETVPGAPMRVVLGHRVWQERFGGRQDILGEVVTVNAEQGEVIGVMPEGFEFPLLQEVWIPNRLDPVALPRGTGRTLEVFGKLREGVDRDAAALEFAGIAESLGREHPETNDGVGVIIKPYTDEFIGGEEASLLYAMLGTVVLVLLIACANVANLLLARASVRTRDMAIRTAMGASRWRVLRQMLAESAVLTVAGAILGTGIAGIGIEMFDRAVAPTDPPFWLVFQLDLPVLLFVVAAATVSALASGLLPGLRASSADVNAILKDESRGSSSRRIGRMSRVLVIGEIAMSMALLFASGLMIRGVSHLNTIDYPFQVEEMFTARLGVFEERYPDAAARLGFWEELEPRLNAIPGARSASLASGLPGLSGLGTQIRIDGESYASDQEIPFTRFSVTTPSWLETVRVTPVRGRWFTALDRQGAPPVAVVNESFVRTHFGGESPIGRSITPGGLESDEAPREIVGVVPDLFMQGIGNTEDPGDGLYLPLAQWDANFLSILVRADSDPLNLTSAVRDAVLATDPDTPIYWVRTLRQSIDESVWFYRIFGGLFIAFGVAALFLASVGLYGVMSFSVGQRSQEMGVRMALGARAAEVRALILRQGLGQILIGVGLGSALAWLVARGLTIVLYQVTPWDPVTFLAVCTVLFGTGLLACVVPAIRATRVDPAVALASE